MDRVESVVQSLHLPSLPAVAPFQKRRKRRLPVGFVLGMATGAALCGVVMWAVGSEERRRPVVSTIRRLVRFRRPGDAELAATLESVLDVPTGVNIAVERGIVFLTGTVPDEETAEELLSRVRDVPGVRGVSHALEPAIEGGL